MRRVRGENDVMNRNPAPRRPSSKVLPPDAPGIRALLSLVTGVAVICALYFGRAVLIPIILAVLLSFLVAPFVDLLRRLKLGQVPSVIVAVVGGFLGVDARRAAVGGPGGPLARGVVEGLVGGVRKNKAA